ncbi:hypothetical protein EC957_000815, partial [Mortierella hygrophila]
LVHWDIKSYQPPLAEPGTKLGDGGDVSRSNTVSSGNSDVGYVNHTKAIAAKEISLLTFIHPQAGIIYKETSPLGYVKREQAADKILQNPHLSLTRPITYFDDNWKPVLGMELCQEK